MTHSLFLSPSHHLFLNFSFQSSSFRWVCDARSKHWCLDYDRRLHIYQVPSVFWETNILFNVSFLSCHEYMEYDFIFKTATRTTFQIDEINQVYFIDIMTTRYVFTFPKIFSLLFQFWFLQKRISVIPASKLKALLNYKLGWSIGNFRLNISSKMYLSCSSDLR